MLNLAAPKGRELFAADCRAQYSESLCFKQRFPKHSRETPNSLQFELLLTAVSLAMSEFEPHPRARPPAPKKRGTE